MFKLLGHIKKEDRQLVGSKAYHLSVLMKHHFKVVDGYVLFGILTEDDFAMSKQHMEKGKKYAVRSSMGDEDGEAVSCAGKFMTVIGIESDELEEAVDTIYKQALENENKAVLVQEVLEAEASGVIFTKNPITGGGMLINSLLGAGENIVSGEENPDEFEVYDDRIVSNIEEKNIVYTYHYNVNPGDEVTLNHVKTRVMIENDGDTLFSVNFKDTCKPSVTDEQIKNIFNQAKEIKRIFEREQDIEFTICNDEIYIMQSRPITHIVSRSEVSENTEVGTVLKGKRVSNGCVKGKAYRIDNRVIEKRFFNQIIIVDEFYPELVYELQSVAAIVTGRGGALSHAAIVAREKGIPCVTGLGENINIIQDGMTIRVDADRGEVVLL